MSEDMSFASRSSVLSLEEHLLIAKAFVELGVSKLRITGGEPLIRRGILQLFEQLGKLKALEQLLVTTNGSQLETMAASLKHFGVHRVNVSLDTLQPLKFKSLTRTGNLEKVLAGIEAAIDAGFERIKINAVILKGRNDDEVVDLVNFARNKNIDLSFIEEMPLGEIEEHDRALSYCSSDEIRSMIHSVFPLSQLAPNAGQVTGPSSYYSMADSAIRVGFISPHSHNFCGQCNRVRVTAMGRLLLCLGNEHSVDLRAIVRKHPNALEPLKEAIVAAMDLKPERHHFDLNEDKPQIVRFMNTTGG